MKKLLLIAITWLISNAAFSQHNFLQGGGGNANDEALDITHDLQGNIYSAGYFSMAARFDNIVIPSSGMSDAFISKQDSTGVYQWVVPAGGIMDEKATAIAMNTAGEIFITGVFRGSSPFGSTTLTSIAGSQDIFVAKLDNSGNFLWAQSYGGPDTDLPSDICLDAAGNIIVSGEFKGTSTFGTFTFTSVNYPPTMPMSGGLPSYDALVFKADASGNVTWAKQGAARYDDRILKVNVDALDNIYVCGQFSDTITFSGTYNNNAFNAGLIMKMDPSGNETWFRRMLSSQFMIYDMKVRDKNIWMTGDFQGTLCYVGTPNQYLTNPSTYKVFTVKVSTITGDYLNGASEGSENQVSSRAITVDAQDGVFTAGYFKCSLTSFSAIHGNGIFNSVGYRDIYLVRYDTLLSRQWEKQYGGIGDDYPTSMDNFFNGQPVFAGSYSKNFNTPDGGYFLTHINNVNTFNGNIGLVLCGTMTGGQFMTQKGWGNKDILVSRPVNSVAPLYDYYQRLSMTCVTDTLMPSRYPSGDTLVACNWIDVGINTPTTVDSLQAPDWVYSWSNGSTHRVTRFTTSGWKYVDYGFADDCRRFVDSFYVQIYITPPIPVINKYDCAFMDAIPVSPCLHKALITCGDTALFVASGVPPGYTFQWTLPGGGTSTSDSVYAAIPGVYTLTSYSPLGLCTSDNCVELYIYGCPGSGGGTLGTCGDLGLVFTDTTFNTTDTVKVCVDDYFEMQLVDTALWNAGLPSYLSFFATWTITGGFHFQPFMSYPNTMWYHVQNFQADYSGPCTATATVIDPVSGTTFCTITRNFWLDTRSAPPNNPVVSGATYFCPGDTVTLTVTGGDNYVWSGPSVLWTNAPDNDTALVNYEGQYMLNSTTVDSVLGCTSYAWQYFNLSSMPAPLVTMNPANGLICPFDSVELTAQPGTSYMWYGPTGMVIGTTASIWVSTPGIYYYTYISSTGCALVSEMVEVMEYSTPYLEGSPGTSLCEGSSMIITLQTNESSLISWGPPFSGSSLTQTVTSPGTYTVSVNSCGITTVANITITSGMGTPVDILYWGNDTICSQDTVILMGAPGYTDYTWFPSMDMGVTYTTTGPGTYFLQATNMSGCVSSDSISIYAYPETAPPVSGDTTVCPGTSLTLSATGLGNIYWFDDLYGGSVIGTGNTLPVTIGWNDSTFYVANDNGTCLSAAIPVNVNIFNGSAIPVILGSNVVCINDTLFLTVASPAPGVTYSWNGPGISGVDSTHLIVYPMSAASGGYYSVTAITGVCTSTTDSIFITVNDPVLTSTAGTFALCQYDTLTLNTDTLAGSYLWNTGSVANSINVTSAGIYYYTFTDAAGCSASSDTSTVIILPAPAVTSIGDTTVCSGTPLTFVVTTDPTLTVTWYDVAFSPIGSGTSYSTTATAPTVIIAIAADTNGCTSLPEYVSIGISAPIPAPILSTDDTVCTGSSLTLLANSLPGYTYYWSGPGGFSSGAVSPGISPVTASTGGTYQLYVVNGYCVSDTGDVEITVEEAPVIIASADTTVCAGTTVTLNAVSSTGTYSWSTGDVTSGITVTPGSTTMFTVSTTNACGTASDNVTVIVNPLPAISAGSDLTLLAGETGMLSGSGAGIYSWSPSTGLSCSNCTNPTFVADQSQFFYLVVTDRNGCSSYDSVYVTVSDEASAFVPSAFSPNGDGLNDLFRVKGDDITSLHMMIFDRWGERLFETSDLNSGWDGKYHGTLVEPGVYVYKIKLSLATGEEYKYSGTVTVVK